MQTVILENATNCTQHFFILLKNWKKKVAVTFIPISASTDIQYEQFGVFQITLPFLLTICCIREKFSALMKFLISVKVA